MIRYVIFSNLYEAHTNGGRRGGRVKDALPFKNLFLLMPGTCWTRWQFSLGFVLFWESWLSFFGWKNLTISLKGLGFIRCDWIGSFSFLFGVLYYWLYVSRRLIEWEACIDFD